jgi:hypothetical protein
MNTESGTVLVVQAKACTRNLSRFLTCALLLLQAGCTVTRITTDHWSIRRMSFLQRLEIPEVEFGSNGVAILRGYRSDGGNQAAAAITAAAVTAAIKSAK